MDHATRCAWIKQNDADSRNHTPYLCGAAAAQMILYGHDSSKFKAASPTKLKDTAAQLRIDQQLIWEAIIDESSTSPLPPGGVYDGVPEETQICEAGGKCWATYPDALARAISDGMSITAGPLAGVPARVVAPADQDDVIQAIVDSLDRGVAAALLIDGWHWVVVYRYRELDNDRVEIYYRNGQQAKTGSTFWLNGAFFAALDAGTGGVFDDRYVMVTAASRVPIVQEAIGRPPIRFRQLRRDPGPTRYPADFPSSLAATLLAELGSDKEWAPAFAGARLNRVLKVRNLMPGGTDYYLVDFVVDSPSATGPVTRRTGSVIVDAYDLRRRGTTGVEEREDELTRLIEPDDIKERLDRLKVPGLVVDEDLVWQPCDQSPSPFLPFYVARDSIRSPKTAAYLRADGEMFTWLTQRLAGI